MTMSTESQIDYYLYLCEQAMVEPEEGYENWDVGKMSGKIKELKEMVED